MPVLSKDEIKKISSELKKPYREIIGEEEASYLESFVQKESDGWVMGIDWNRFYRENGRSSEREERMFILLSEMDVLSPEPHMNYYIHEGSIYMGPWGGLLPLYFTRPDLAKDWVEKTPGVVSRYRSIHITGPEYSEIFKKN